jgi:hypothetical protein
MADQEHEYKRGKNEVSIFRDNSDRNIRSTMSYETKGI